MVACLANADQRVQTKVPGRPASDHPVGFDPVVVPCEHPQTAEMSIHAVSANSSQSGLYGSQGGDVDQHQRVLQVVRGRLGIPLGRLMNTNRDDYLRDI